MKTSFEHPAFDNPAKVTCHKRFNVTLIRPSDSDEVSMEMITAPELSVAFMSARHIFPGARILSIAPMAASPPQTLHKAPPQTGRETHQSPGARFIHGQFRPALFADETELIRLED